ncbi:MAG TPA: YkvA family protein [Actinomycetales bacterium]|jgi:uncharacterized membrane protein YkvA (DUF1232 family)
MARTNRTASVVALVRALRAATRPGEPDLKEHLSAVPRLVRSTMLGDYHGTTRARLGTVAMGVLYVVSPFDLVPEMFLPVIGLADDALVLGWVARRVLGETGAFLRWERERPGAPRSGGATPAADDVVPGQVIR